MKEEFLETALECIQNHRYGAAANNLEKAGESKLQAECERLQELLGNHTEMLGGKAGQVVSNYEDRLLDEIARKIGGGSK